MESVQMDNQELDGRLAAKRSMEIDLRMWGGEFWKVSKWTTKK